MLNIQLFAGRPTVKKLSLWNDDAVFEDPLTNAKGRKQYSAQWYGLAAAFSEIERLSHQVTSTGNPITLQLKQRYVVKGVGKEQTVNSEVKIFSEGGKITKVEDRWDGSLPEGAFKTVRLFSILSWLKFVECLLFWLWSFTWSTWWWKVSREHLHRLGDKRILMVAGFEKSQRSGSPSCRECSEIRGGRGVEKEAVGQATQEMTDLKVRR